MFNRVSTPSFQFNMTSENKLIGFSNSGFHLFMKEIYNPAVRTLHYALMYIPLGNTEFEFS